MRWQTIGGVLTAVAVVGGTVYRWPSSDAVSILCPVRLNAKMIAKAQAAGLVFRHAKQKYVRAETVAFAFDGGLADGVMDVGGGRYYVPLSRDQLPDGGDAPGQSVFDVMEPAACTVGACGAWCTSAFPMRLAQSPCVRRPSDGGVCRRPREAPMGGTSDGGLRMGGLGEVWRAVDGFQGAGCERVECQIMLGDDPEVDL